MNQGLGLQHFYDIFQHNYSNLTHANMKVFWKDVESKNVAKELKQIFDYVGKGSKPNRVNNSYNIGQIQQHILDYCDIPNIKSTCEIIVNLQFLFREAELDKD